jgi:hypothetical protein
MVAPEARHLERIGDAAAGFLGQVLQVGVDIVVRDEHRFTFLEQALDACFEFGLFSRRRRGGRARPCFGGAAGTGGGTVVFEGLDR